MQMLFKHIRWMPVLMGLTILGIAGFQMYWLNKAYEREKRTLEIRSNMAFRESVYSLQATKLNLDKVLVDHGSGAKIRLSPSGMRRFGSPQKVTRIFNELNKKIADSAFVKDEVVLVQRAPGQPRDTLKRGRLELRDNQIVKFLYEMEASQDSITVSEVRQAVHTRLRQQNINVPFTITREARAGDDERSFNKISLGFRNPVTYSLNLGNTFPYLIKRIAAPILLSIFLVAFTIISFWLLYRNLLRQRRLADIKNEFISNITHELKTPIATVSVAIEALRSFNANLDPQKTKEYLDISSNELQRLSLLVDKVLKLSMFEKTEVDLKYEPLDMRSLVEEVTASMRLQFEKHRAEVKVSTEGDTTLEGDRLHLVSVIFNLLDNALKYGNGSPEIDIKVNGGTQRLTLCIADNGIGVPPEYRDKIFEKFFRVPTGNLHNAKGYGLGLSYVSHVIKKHQGTIRVESVEGTGSRFVITLPKKPA